jgi:hypothetical protein
MNKGVSSHQANDTFCFSIGTHLLLKKTRRKIEWSQNSMIAGVRGRDSEEVEDLTSMTSAA